MATTKLPSDSKQKRFLPKVAAKEPAGEAEPILSPPLPSFPSIASVVSQSTAKPPAFPPAGECVLPPWRAASISFGHLDRKSEDADANADSTGENSVAAETTTSKRRAVPPEFAEIGPYRLLELIGEGGMGLVYRAEDKYLKRIVALKMMKPNVAKDERSWKSFLTEARAAAALKDDRIETIYHFDEIDGQLCLAMELLKGEAFEGRLLRGEVA